MRVSHNFLQYKPLHWKDARLLPADAPVLQCPVQSMPLLSAALSRFQQLRGPPGATFWSLLNEPAHTTPAAEQWFDDAVRLAGVELDYTLYSCRRGGASAAAAVGVPLHKVEALGGWSADSSALRKRYLDHAVPADAHASMFFASLVHSAVASMQLFNT
jgi:hypothetical protein